MYCTSRLQPSKNATSFNHISFFAWMFFTHSIRFFHIPARLVDTENLNNPFPCFLVFAAEDRSRVSCTSNLQTTGLRVEKGQKCTGAGVCRKQNISCKTFRGVFQKLFN